MVVGGGGQGDRLEIHRRLPALVQILLTKRSVAIEHMTSIVISDLSVPCC